LLDSLDEPMREVTGFTEVEIDQMLGEKKTRERVPKDTGHAQYSRRGDVWLLGEHRLGCGDSCCAADVDRLMAGDIARLVVTDPPYNVNYGDKAEMLEDYLGAGNRITSAILNDNMDDVSFRKFLLDAYVQMFRVMADGAAIYVFHSETEGINFRTAFKEAGFYLSQCLIWLKSSIVLGRNDYHWRHEPALYGWKGTGTHKWYGGRKRSTALVSEGLCVTVKKEAEGDVIAFSDGFNNFIIRAREYEVIDDGHDDTMSVIYYDKPASSDIHPTMKPVGLLVKLIKNSSRKSEIVLDPFGGSGSTLMACEETGRVCRTMELDEHYCDVIVERYIEVTSRQDVFLIRDGERIPYGEVHG
jgi:DNA modification methylase